MKDSRLTNGPGITENDRKTYMRDVYSKYWITARESIYGFPEYDKRLCQHILDHVPPPGRMLEVAIGTGYPFADFLQKSGYEVHGIDISPALVAKCAKINPKIKAIVGDAEALPYPDTRFDCTYCFHSTWYFPRLTKVIDEMLRVTLPGGLVMFDIQNRNNDHILHIYRKRLFENRGLGRLVKVAKNLVKTVLRRGVPDWHFVDYEVPTFPEEIYAHLQSAPVRSWGVFVRKADDVLEAPTEQEPFKEYQRLVFFMTKA
jgi:ubiquinone/menaquinone biosynthesis C-methylase UbiE